LVGWKHYLKAISTKGFLYSFAAVVGFGGVLLVLISLFMFLIAVLPWQEGGNSFGVLAALVIAAVGIAAIWAGKSVVSEVQELEQVQLITRQNTHLLPTRTSLVRASDAPASDSQAELLRAAGQGTETPAEQLLRAGEMSSYDA